MPVASVGDDVASMNLKQKLNFTNKTPIMHHRIKFKPLTGKYAKLNPPSISKRHKKFNTNRSPKLIYLVK